MTSYLPKDASDEVLKVIRASQQTVVDVVRAWADAVSPVLQSVAAVPIPFADQLPKPEDVDWRLRVRREVPRQSAPVQRGAAEGCGTAGTEQRAAGNRGRRLGMGRASYAAAPGKGAVAYYTLR